MKKGSRYTPCKIILFALTFSFSSILAPFYSLILFDCIISQKFVSFKIRLGRYVSSCLNGRHYILSYFSRQTLCGCSTILLFLYYYRYYSERRLFSCTASSYTRVYTFCTCVLGPTDIYDE